MTLIGIAADARTEEIVMGYAVSIMATGKDESVCHTVLYFPNSEIAAVSDFMIFALGKAKEALPESTGWHKHRVSVPVAIYAQKTTSILVSSHTPD